MNASPPCAIHIPFAVSGEKQPVIHLSLRAGVGFRCLVWSVEIQWVRGVAVFSGLSLAQASNS